MNFDSHFESETNKRASAAAAKAELERLAMLKLERAVGAFRPVVQKFGVWAAAKLQDSSVPLDRSGCWNIPTLSARHVFFTKVDPAGLFAKRYWTRVTSPGQDWCVVQKDGGCAPRPTNDSSIASPILVVGGYTEVRKRIEEVDFAPGPLFYIDDEERPMVSGGISDYLNDITPFDEYAARSVARLIEAWERDKNS